MNAGEHDAPARLVPDEPLPAYAYVTGRFPHPTRDPAGHSFGRREEDAPPLDPRRWHESRAYLVGCDLFNHGYYWEAHETWEAAWKACGRRGTTADFLKGLIKLAAAGVKAREGRAAGVERHAARALALFRGVRQEIAAPLYLGLNVDELMEIGGRLMRGIELPAASEAAVEVVFDFRLLPEMK